jgi:hypothetical protein
VEPSHVHFSYTHHHDAPSNPHMHFFTLASYCVRTIGCIQQHLVNSATIKLFKIGAVGGEYVMTADMFVHHAHERSIYTAPNPSVATVANAHTAAAATATGAPPTAGVTVAAEPKTSTEIILGTDALLTEIMKCKGVSITRADLLANTGGNPAGLTTLVRRGLLLHRDSLSYWLSIPNAGLFMKDLRKGREELVRMLKRAKFKEVLQHDLVKRKLRGSKLGVKYHVADLVGMGVAKLIQTTSGPLIRFDHELDGAL